MGLSESQLTLTPSQPPCSLGAAKTLLLNYLVVFLFNHPKQMGVTFGQDCFQE